MVDTRAGLAAEVLNRWRWLVLYALLSLLLRSVVPDFVAVAPPVNLLDTRTSWTVGSGMLVEEDARGIRFTHDDVSDETAYASSPVAVPWTADFLALTACPVEGMIQGQDTALMLASLARSGSLDFDRQYSHGRFPGPGGCVTDRLPRLEGDGGAVLQLQLPPGQSVTLASLTLEPLAEARPWWVLRHLALSLGLLLLAQVFGRYAFQAPRWLAAAVLMTVAGILFGCCVSVGLKADFHALFTGAWTEGAVTASVVGPMMEAPFPRGGLPLFTLLHCLLFAQATVLLGLLCGWRCLPDLLLLAILSETLQIFVPGRGPGLSDAMVDWSGVLLGSLLLELLSRSGLLVVAQRKGLLLQQ